MKCMKCKQNEANVYITTSINGKVKKECLCERCAGMVHSKQMMNMDKLFAKMISPSHAFDMFDFKMPRLNDSFFETRDVFFEDMFRDFDNMNNLVKTAQQMCTSHTGTCTNIFNYSQCTFSYIPVYR